MANAVLKAGVRSHSGLEEAVYQNIEMCMQLVRMIRTSLGPNGLFKMILNRLEKLIVTKNASAIASELDVTHPAAKMLVMAAQNQALEYGDGTNLVMVLAGELLDRAKNLLQQGLVVVDILAGYEYAYKYLADEILNAESHPLISRPVVDLHDPTQLALILKPALASKQYGYEDFLSNLVAEACTSVMPEDCRLFNTEAIRIAKVPGRSVRDSFLVRGFVIPALPKGSVTKMETCRIAVYGCAVELDRMETKGTVLLSSAEELLDLSASEERAMEARIREFAEAGINVIVSQMSFTDLAIHYCNKYGVMALKIGSKFEVRRFAKSVGAAVLMSLRIPTAEQIGKCSEMVIEEIGDKQVVIARDLEESGKGSAGGDAKEEVHCRDIVTIILRAATDNVLNDVSVAIGNAINVAKAACTDDRFLPGAGAAEAAMTTQLRTLANHEPGLKQYSIRAYAEALESIPRILAETSGLPVDKVMEELQAAHVAQKVNTGVDIEADTSSATTFCCDARERQIYDNVAIKNWALRMATDTACNILRVDVIVMRKAAGGPAPRTPGQAEWN